ncbi:MAG TPA: hypothetical protein H9778_08785 [Candidatus Parabacteroides intestinavium]|nr:hypothetical protein [Candidatus Parabacteroides intestinavium]
MEDFLGFWAITCAVALPIVFAIVALCVIVKSRHEERMKMIEKGIILAEPEKPANRYPALRNGLFMIGLALGIIVGILFQPLLLGRGFDLLIIPMFAVLFSGLAFVFYFYFSRKMLLKEETENEGKSANNCLKAND